MNRSRQLRPWLTSALTRGMVLSTAFAFAEASRSALLMGSPAWAQSVPQPGTLDLRTGGDTPAQPSPTPPPTAGEPEVLVAEVVVEGTEDPELIDQVYKVIRTRAGEVSTRSQLREDINAVFATGLFADVRAVPSDTPLGVRVTFEVKPNPILKAVRTEGAKVLDPEVLRAAFADQEGRVLNFGKLQSAVAEIEQWYADKGYVLAKVTDVRSSEDGTITLEIAEGVIEDIRVQGNTKTRDFIITRELKSKPGDVFNRNQIQEDLQAVFNLNLFQDVNVGLNPGQDPDKVVVVVNVEERRTGTLGGTIGVSSATGVFAGLNVSEQNLGGNNQSASFNVQVGTNETLFDLNFTDPRIATLEIPTSYNVNISNQQSSSFVFNEGFTLPNGDPVRINRLGGGGDFLSPDWGQLAGQLGHPHPICRSSQQQRGAAALRCAGQPDYLQRERPRQLHHPAPRPRQRRPRQPQQPQPGIGLSHLHRTVGTSVSKWLECQPPRDQLQPVHSRQPVSNPQRATAGIGL
jgi:outer membrane protein insertion porin family